MAGLNPDAARRGWLLALPALLAACAGDGGDRPFSVRDLAKSDIDDVVEIVQADQLASLKTLALKLYRRNPAEWRKLGVDSAEAATAQRFAPLAHWQLAPGRTQDWQTLILAAWRDDTPGDRVGALLDGLLAMQLAAYGHRTEFWLWSELDAQKLYHAARNFEAVAWALANRRDAQGRPRLLSNALDEGGVANLSFEREFGKLIALNDALARIVVGKTHRAIRTGVVNFAGFVLLPI